LPQGPNPFYVLPTPTPTPTPSTNKHLKAILIPIAVVVLLICIGIIAKYFYDKKKASDLKANAAKFIYEN